MDQTKKVRDIGGHKELFIDGAPVASMRNVRLTMNAPYQDHEPVLLPQAPWEYRIHPYATVLREGDTFRLWYLAYEWDPPAGVDLPVSGAAADAALFWQHTRGRLCYAESSDGVHWQRPNLSLVDYRGSGDNNILGPAVHDSVRQAGCNAGTVFKDPTAPPERQYKLWSEIKVAQRASPACPASIPPTACAGPPARTTRSQAIATASTWPSGTSESDKTWATPACGPPTAAATATGRCGGWCRRTLNTGRTLDSCWPRMSSTWRCR